MDTKKIIITVAIIVLAFLVINSLIPEKEQEEVPTQTTVQYKTCEERCQGNQECLKDCYITTINIAILESDVTKCDKIPVPESKQYCIDSVYYKIATTTNDETKCDSIQDSNLKSNCFENVQ